MDFSQFNSSEQAHMTKVIEKKQMQDFMRLYSGLVERCFSACAQDFTTKALTGAESTCVQNCADKFLKHSERIGARFAEFNAATTPRVLVDNDKPSNFESELAAPAANVRPALSHSRWPEVRWEAGSPS
ncbi:protein transporter tim9 [Cryptotrichosporon argae]